ncbi:B3 domain-containing protein REM14-like [Bidens hawaiensis]|uniref:B3 domain-containing protein REM14-like n=1 Tax=Bidens hawaiensis TaxID=980011 RepID=UPI0040490D27
MHPVVLYHKDKDWFILVEFTNGRYVFQNGWAQFVEDNRLMFGDVLVFSPINENEWRFVYVRDHPVHDDMVVDVVVRYPTLKYLKLESDEIESDDESEQRNQVEGLDVWMEYVDEPVLDIIVLHVQEDNILEVIVRDRLRLPVEFARNNNLDVETYLVLINPNGVDVSTGIAIELNGINERYSVRHWTTFVRSNGLQY